MLTKKDLNLIKGIVKTEIDSSLDVKLKPISKKLNKIEKTLDKTIDFFDVRELKIVEEIRIIQKHVGLPIMEFV
jgi:hypothetical protein